MASRLIFSLRYSSKIYIQFLQLFISLVVLLSLIRANLYFLSVYHATSNVDFFDILEAFFVGLRFDILVMGFVFILPTVLLTVQAVTVQWSTLTNTLHKLYFFVIWVLMSLMIYVDFFHFAKFGRHMRWREYESLDFSQYYSWIESSLPSQFWIFTLMVAFFLGIGLAAIRSLDFGHWKDEFSPRKPWFMEKTVRILWPLLFVALCARGSLGQHHLRLEDSQVSKNEAINEMALNAIWCFDK
ncbi:hypothetical protein BDW_01035 [Bdellovibrio bacteriovorus W]|nr:hypothetical protein BDW_01035 [Bdellovibrio bacteriovorus W]